jgi:hypothetical protein
VQYRGKSMRRSFTVQHVRARRMRPRLIRSGGKKYLRRSRIRHHLALALPQRNSVKLEERFVAPHSGGSTGSEHHRAKRASGKYIL